MIELEKKFCPNKLCKQYGLSNKGNISIRGKYGKDKSRTLLYCRTCGKRFASTHSSPVFGTHIPAETIRQIIHHTAEGVGVRATARLLGLDKDTVNRVILRADEHCARVLSDLLMSLELTDTQIDELWSFVKKRKILAAPKTSKAKTDEHGSAQLA
ncbi:helix-turn-helix domain-containing protein [Desulfonatronovibrio magnus]|uniref:helix-turn-helix domain-containing protein n=1 Tax=Desulfonatronovibrio magnus TaxID=698827 RepID=UPI0005EBCE40|nr:helix-turn-helix domain-containing protein [Desulfonatronovibrio magnus]